METKTEKIGSAFILNVQFEGRTLTGIASQVPGSRSFRVFIPGVCNLEISQDDPGHWRIESGREIIPELVQEIGESLFS